MRVSWTDIFDRAADAFDGAEVELGGWPITAEPAAAASYLLLMPEPACCAGCLPSDPRRCVEVFAADALPLAAGHLTLHGRLRRLEADPNGWRYQLIEARAVEQPIKREAAFSQIGRRQVLAGPLLCLPMSGPAMAAPAVDPALDIARAFLADRASVDVHSHAGALLRLGRAGTQPAFEPLAAPMRVGGLAVTCLAVVPDLPTLRVGPDGRIRAFRVPVPGELRASAERGFQRLHALVRAEGLAIITDPATLARARPAAPSVLVAAEGADFLEGDVAVLETAYNSGLLRHLQLTHYSVNELGDIQTEAPVHNGLTAFGADVIRRCQRMGIIVDVAHGTEALVRQAVEVTSKPLVLSHTSLTRAPRPFTRLITAEHARLVAGTGGMIGVWPPANLFPDLEALADGVARMIDTVGVAHVGIGTDMMGLAVPSAIPGYEHWALLAATLLRRFTPDETTAILGGNYLRVARECLGADPR